MLACNRTRCAKGEALSRKADRLSWESWNERMWADGGPIDPSPTVDHALEIKCSRCLVKRVVSLAELPQSNTTCIHDLAARLGCSDKRRRQAALATLLQLAHGRRHATKASVVPELIQRRTGDRLRPGKSGTATCRSVSLLSETRIRTRRGLAPQKGLAAFTQSIG
jgi:hypothetical protein